MIDLNDYSKEQHILEIVGLTQVTEILRTTVQFYGEVAMYQSSQTLHFIVDVTL